MIDFHCHLLPALDDGPAQISGSLGMASLLFDFGFRRVCCTPHSIRGYYDTLPEAVESAVATLQEELTEAAISLQLLPGMEYYLDEFFLEQERLLPLGASRLVLVEAPAQAMMEVVRAGLTKVLGLGLTPLIAHPERSEVFSRPLIAEVVEEGCLLQANYGSFTGYYGPQVQRRAYQLLRDGAYSRVGSDGHDAAGLSVILPAAWEKIAANPTIARLATNGFLP